MCIQGDYVQLGKKGSRMNSRGIPIFIEEMKTLFKEVKKKQMVLMETSGGKTFKNIEW